jgi:integrase
MARHTERLSSAKVKNAKVGLHPDGGNLWLQVTQAKDGKRLNKSWLLIFKSPVAGKQREMGLGPLATVGLAEAREKARDCRKLLLEGVDPIEHREARRAAIAIARAKSMTFGQCATAYMASHESGWRNAKHRDQWRTSLETYAYPILEKLPVADIDTALVMRVLQPMWNDKAETASRVRGRIESILDWATTSGYRSGENCARWKGHLANLLPARNRVQKIEHLAAMPYASLPAFLIELRARGGVAAQALELLILTAGRTGEVLGARWGEIDLAAKAWTIPANRMKGGREHRVPLSQRALEILDGVRNLDSPLVFPGTREGKPLSELTLLRAFQRMGYAQYTVHGFRSAFKDWCSDRTSYPNHVVEAALAHAIPSGVEAAYRRTDLLEQRARLMAAWAEYCGKEPATSEVVPLRSAQS